MVFQVYQNMKHATISRMSKKSSSFPVARVLQLLLQALSILIAATIVGTAAQVYRTYVSQRAANNPIWLPLWPDHFDATGTKVQIGTFSAITFLCLISVVLYFFPATSQPKLSGLILVATSTLSIILAISSIAVSSLLEQRTADSETLRSWTCKFGGDALGKPLPSFLSNGDFNSLCQENMFSFYAGIPVLAMQTILLAVGISQWLTSGTPPASPVMGDKSSDY